MNDRPPPSADAIAQAAAEWTARLDRGLTAAEQDGYSRWLAADPRHRAALAEHRWSWEELDRLAGLQEAVPAPPDAGLLAPARAASARGRLGARFAVAGLLAAACLALGAWWLARRPPALLPPRADHAALAAPCERRDLADGSVVELNRGAAVAIAYTPEARRVRLEQGEASFTVAKDAARPFVVEAGGVAVRAVGTVFNVHVGPAGVEVVVAEGRVRIEGGAGEAPFVAAGQGVVVPRAPAAPPPEVITLAPAQLAARLAWQPRLLDFTRAPLAEIVAELNRRNPVRIVVADPALRALRLSATLRSDNVAGFLRLLESDFGMTAEWRGPAEVALLRAE